MSPLRLTDAQQRVCHFQIGDGPPQHGTSSRNQGSAALHLRHSSPRTSRVTRLRSTTSGSACGRLQVAHTPPCPASIASYAFLDSPSPCRSRHHRDRLLCQALGRRSLIVLRAAPRVRALRLSRYSRSFACRFLRLPFLTDQLCPDGVRARSCSAVRNSMSRLRAISGVRRRAGESPGVAPDRRAWKQVSATARDQRALPDRNAVSHFAQIYTDVPMLCPDARRRAQNHRSSAHPQKAFRPGMLEPRRAAQQQRSGVQTQFWSVLFIRDSLLQVNLNCLGPSAAASKPSSRIFRPRALPPIFMEISQFDAIQSSLLLALFDQPKLFQIKWRIGPL